MSFYLEKWRFFRGQAKTVLMRKYSQKKWPNNFFWQVSEIRAKVLRNPINLPAPTRMTAKS